jgi:hypothetical protein
MPERRTIMDLLYAMRDLGVADPAADSTGEETGRAALAQEIDAATSSRRPGRARRTRPRLLAGASLAVAGSATAVALLVSATASPPPAFAVTRHHDGLVSVKINRRSGIAGANRKLAAMGIHERLYAVPTRLSGVSHPLSPGGPQSCLRDKQKGGVVQVFFPSAAAQKAAVETGTYVPPGNAGNTGGPPNNDTFVVITCPTSGPGSTVSGPTRFEEPVNSGNTSSTGSGNIPNTGNTGAG